MSHLCSNQKARILKLSRTSSKPRIAKTIGCHVKTVYNIINKYENADGKDVDISSNTRNKGNSYTKQEEASVVNYFKIYCFATINDSKVHLNLKFSPNTSFLYMFQRRSRILILLIKS